MLQCGVEFLKEREKFATKCGADARRYILMMERLRRPEVSGYTNGYEPWIRVAVIACTLPLNLSSLHLDGKSLVDVLVVNIISYFLILRHKFHTKCFKYMSVQLACTL